MPWHWEPTKDVVSCDKLRGDASNLWSVDIRMEQSAYVNMYASYTESIGIWGEPPELKHLSRARKRNQRDSVSSGERNRKRPNRKEQSFRGYGLHLALIFFSRIAWEGEPKSVRVAYTKRNISEQYPEYRRTRGTRWEVGGTTLQA